MFTFTESVQDKGQVDLNNVRNNSTLLEQRHLARDLMTSWRLLEQLFLFDSARVKREEAGPPIIFEGVKPRTYSVMQANAASLNIPHHRQARLAIRSRCVVRCRTDFSP